MKYKCVEDCWDRKTLYIAGFEYDIKKDSSVAMFFVDENGERLAERPPRMTFKMPEETPEAKDKKIIELQEQLLKAQQGKPVVQPVARKPYTGKPRGRKSIFKSAPKETQEPTSLTA